MSNKKEWVSYEELGVTDKSVRLLTELLNGSYVGIDPLTEIPDSQMTIYGIREAFKKMVFFDTKEETEVYAKRKGIDVNNIKTFEYLGSVAGREDVIRKTTVSGETEFLVAIDEDGYGSYDKERSVWQNKFIWKYVHGNIKDIYDAFKARGQKLKEDRCGQIEEENQRLLELTKSVWGNFEAEEDGK